MKSTLRDLVRYHVLEQAKWFYVVMRSPGVKDILHTTTNRMEAEEFRDMLESVETSAIVQYEVTNALKFYPVL